MDYKKEKDKLNIIQNYNRQCMKLVDIASDLLSDDPTFDWFTRILKIVKNENPSYLIDRGVDKFWTHKEHIINRNIEFFNNSSLQQKYIKDDKNKEWLVEFTNILKTEYHNLSIKERDLIWECVTTMLECVIKYKLLNADSM
jgi:hypothetical protein